MNSIAIVLCIGIFLFIIQSIFIIFCLRWLASGKRKRDKEFAILDSERGQLIEMQSALSQEVQDAKKLANDTLNKLRIIGSEAHAEWEDVTKKINSVLLEVDKHSGIILEDNLSKLAMRSMSVEKIMKDAQLINEKIVENTRKAQKVLKLFDTNVPNEEIFKEIQSEKYFEAKKLLSEGVDASVVVKKLGLSMSEVVLLSAYI
ncbi:hypothetical protein [Fluviispira multicolorata]|uniref:DUF2802 domain-containing protein n=1 Tax=Fluviispira multicolorata TaxID=2654512 RepID=A0A833JAB3_9BACT|nr:hypothetical protein [Fluviispira multicolorata]KAB8027731.1 hypothetical protein GCL57_14060 [Fluviispira multicolorata]